MDDKDRKILVLGSRIEELTHEVNETRRVLWNMIHLVENHKRDDALLDEAYSFFLERG